MTAEPPRAGGFDFATLLHQRRRAAGLTQAELASLAGLAVRTVREVERGRTARVQRTTAVLLANALGLVGEERSVFLAAARGEGAAGRVGGTGSPLLSRPRAAAARGVPPLPVPEPFGRDAQLERLAELVTGEVGQGRPVTPAAPLSLVGVAGVGKTVLAQALAYRVADRFPGGVVAVSAGHDTTSSEVVEAIGSRAAGPVLLWLDAVELAAAQVRAALARLPPAVRVLASGRAPLGVPGERVWPVPPLAVPPASVEVQLADIARYPAVALVLDRLARVRPEPLAGDEVPALVGLVRRLGGLPLALESVAGQGRLLRLPEILERYGDRVLDLRTGSGVDSGGEGTLREAMAGCYRLLSSMEQQVLRRLVVFRSRWSVELAEQLLAEEPGSLGVADPVPLLDRLASVGLVGVHGSGEHRFQVLEVVRDYAAEQAGQRGELVRARRAHAVVVARLVSRTAPELADPAAPAAVARLDIVAADVWSALSHVANEDPPTALRLAASLPRWWRLRGRDVVGRRWLRRLLDDPRTAGSGSVVRAWAQLGLAELAQEHGEGGAEWAAAEAALVEFRRLGDVAGELAACGVLSSVAWAEGWYGRARAICESALRVASRAGRLREAIVAQRGLVRDEIRAGDLEAARRRLGTVDRWAAQAGEQRMRVVVAANLAEVARLEGRYGEAVAIGGRVLTRLPELGDPVHRRQLLGTLGQAYAASGRAEDAGRVLSALRDDAAGGARVPVGRGLPAMIEGRLALAAGDRRLAQNRFGAAVSAFRGDGGGSGPGGSGSGGSGPGAGGAARDRRALLEALVGLAAATTDAGVRQRAMAELGQVAGEGGFALLPVEQGMLRSGAGGAP